MYIKFKIKNLQQKRNLLRKSATSLVTRNVVRGNVCTDMKSAQLRRTQLGGTCVTIRETELNFCETGLKKPIPIFRFAPKRAKSNMAAFVVKCQSEKGIVSEENAEPGFRKEPANA